jgi:hypothetical protein
MNLDGRIIGGGGADATAQTLRQRLSHTVEGHKEEVTAYKSTITEQQAELNKQKEQLERLNPKLMQSKHSYSKDIKRKKKQVVNKI